ncbi:hypothetical protein AALP_AA3G287600 [Arabis alpina]|uniref:Uncharacterized protein n=1 Tax=Arabis alpina TaxID=50452 RepID=A0A087HCD4_ARAAL|nr:hypothetical protein AALP_AA3G287600 [Arabis alpina]
MKLCQNLLVEVSFDDKVIRWLRTVKDGREAKEIE